MGNVNPVVVLTEGKYLVYDGNRRISALKILRNPEIVEDIHLRQKVTKLIKDEDISFIEKVFVYITDEEEALEIMDKTHTGEQQGAGMISWEPFQRDCSLHRRGKSLLYPYAFRAAVALNYNIKSFEKISYTDLDRLLGSTVLRDKFNLSESDSNYKNTVNYIVGMLVKYKKEKKFKSFSRHFNKTSSTNEGPMVEFCNWVDEQEASKKNFYFESQTVEIYIDEAFSLDLLGLKIFDKNKDPISYDQNDLVITYVTPNGIETDKFTTEEVGIWDLNLEFKGEQYSEKIIVKELLPPRIDFDSTHLFGEGNTINLRKLMIRAIDTHNNDKTAEVQITAKSHVDIVKDTFTTKNPIGEYIIKYSFIDTTGAPFSRTKKIKIIDKSNPLLAENRDAPLISYNGAVTLINISEIVNKLVNEINGLSLEENICILTTSLRTLLELSLDELHLRGKLIFSPKANLEKRINEFLNFLSNGELSKLCTDNPRELPSFNTEKNNLNLIEPTKLSSLLNLATHKSISRIDVTKVAETARKEIAPLLVYISLLLK
jgi:hypothetical protein